MEIDEAIENEEIDERTKMIEIEGTEEKIETEIAVIGETAEKETPGGIEEKIEAGKTIDIEITEEIVEKEVSIENDKKIKMIAPRRRLNKNQRKSKDGWIHFLIGQKIKVSNFFFCVVSIFRETKTIFLKLKLTFLDKAMPKPREFDPMTGEERPREDDESNDKVTLPSFEVSGKLAADTNTFKGVVIKYNQPDEAAVPKLKWRLYPMKVSFCF